MNQGTTARSGLAPLDEREAARPEQPELPGGPAQASSTYLEILRSSAVIGGSSAINMAIGLVRTKAMAMMLGPAGFGLMAAFSTVADLARTFAELGINSSGVRQIAESAGTGDLQRIARTVYILRRTAAVLGILGTLLLAAFAKPVAVLTFGDDEHADAIALLSIAVFLRLVSDGQGALLQGLRRIGDIAKVGILGSLLGAVFSVALVYWLRERGVALALVAMAAMSLLMSWWFARKVQIGRPALDVSQMTQEVRALLRLGLAFMSSALLTMGAAYVVRIILIREQGLEAAGLFQAAWAVGGIYVMFILQAMATDFYPRLVAAADNDAECNRIVNEQARVSLLLASAGVLATLTFAPWAIRLLYSGDFDGATEVLRWICLGMALRVVTWPLGYILVAKGRQMLFVGTDLAWTFVNVILTWYCVRRFGLAGAGLAFFGSYVFHFLVVYPICRKLTGFRWSAANFGTSFAFMAVIAVVQAGFYVFGPETAIASGAVAVLFSAAASLYLLGNLAGAHGLSGKLAWLNRARSRGR
ncbi:MAG: O-antigen translocase [Burkholderiaceae bacterium]|jgi:PST family polysaccharide transporter|nr:O-antigen translocase [Burkholderiaceae bacterium]